MKRRHFPLPCLPLLLLAAIAPRIHAQLPPALPGQDKLDVPAANLFRAEPLEFSKEVAEAPIWVRKVVPGIAEGGGNLIMDLISPPEPALETLAKAVTPAVPVKPWTAEQRAAMRAAAPTQILLFSPSIVIFDGGISRLAYSAVLPAEDSNSKATSAKAAPHFENYVIWTTANLESVRAVGDLNVGKTRWLLSPSVVRASAKGVAGRFAGSLNVPGIAEFGPPGEAAFLVEKGNAENAAALEPVMALLSKYADPVESARIAEDFSRMTAFQEAAAAWEKEHPRPVQDTVIKFWPVKSTEYPTAPAAASSATVPAIPIDAPALPAAPGAAAPFNATTSGK